MSTIITKPANVKFRKKDVCFEIIFKRPYYISFAYVQDNTIYIQKFGPQKEDQAWKCLESLTKCPFIAFFHSYREKVFEKDFDNLCPISLDGDLAYVSAGPVLILNKKQKKKYSDARYFKISPFDPLKKIYPNFSSDFAFSFEGKWLMERIVSDTSAMAFINKAGDISIINESNGEIFNDMWIFNTDLVKSKCIC